MKLLNQQFFTILELDRQFAFELTDMFEKSTLEILKEFELAVDKKDINKCKKLMHTAKGSAANFGAEKLMTKFKEVENNCENMTDENKNEFLDETSIIKDLLEYTLEEVNSHK